MRQEPNWVKESIAWLGSAFMGAILVSIAVLTISIAILMVQEFGLSAVACLGIWVAVTCCIRLYMW